MEKRNWEEKEKWYGRIENIKRKRIGKQNKYCKWKEKY